MPRGGHFGGWWPLPKDFFRSRWKRFYKRSYREGIRGRSRNGVDRPPPYEQARFSHDVMPSPWKLQYSATNFDFTPPDQRRHATNMYNFNVMHFLDPYKRCLQGGASMPAARDTILRALDPGVRMRGSDSGLGRSAFIKRIGQETKVADHVPSHIYNLMQTHSRGSENGQLCFGALADDEGTQPEQFLVRRLYELCEESELVWQGTQEEPRDDEEEEGDRGRFPKVDEQAGLVDDLQLQNILKLRHKTARRRHPKWIEIQGQYKRWKGQYERRRVMLKDEVKARMHLMATAASE